MIREDHQKEIMYLMMKMMIVRRISAMISRN